MIQMNGHSFNNHDSGQAIITVSTLHAPRWSGVSSGQRALSDFCLHRCVHRWSRCGDFGEDDQPIWASWWFGCKSAEWPMLGCLILMCFFSHSSTDLDYWILQLIVFNYKHHSHTYIYIMYILTSGSIIIIYCSIIINSVHTVFTCI